MEPKINTTSVKRVASFTFGDLPVEVVTLVSGPIPLKDETVSQTISVPKK